MALMVAGILTLAASSTASASQTTTERVVIEPEQEITDDIQSDNVPRLTIREEKKEAVRPMETPKPTDEEPIFMTAEQMPEYQGGMEVLLRDLNARIHYPIVAAENNIQGKVIVQFVVEKDGSIGQVKIARSSGDNSLDHEAIRVSKTLDKFNPGKQNGQPVRSWFTLPR